MTVRIVTDSTAYLPTAQRKELGIDLVSLYIHHNGEVFREVDLDNGEFYQRIAGSKSFPSSSQPSLDEMRNAFEKGIQQQEPLVGIFLSSKMSGTYESAHIAREMVLEKHPDAVIELVDSRSNSMELGFAVLGAARAAKAGKNVVEVKAAAHHIINRSRFIFVPQVLDYLKKSGRLSGAGALIGSVLQIRPVLTVLDGAATVLEKVRTTGKAVELVLQTFLEDVRNKGLGEVVVHHINNELEGRRLASRIERELGVSPDLIPIGPVIGSHVGPGAIGIAYYTRDELDQSSASVAAAF